MRLLRLIITVFFYVSLFEGVLLSEELAGVPLIIKIKYKNKDAEKFDLDKEAAAMTERMPKSDRLLTGQSQIYEILKTTIGEKHVRIDFNKIDLDKFAEHIKSKRIYDPKLWDTGITQMQVHNALLSTSSFLNDKFFKFLTDSLQIEKDFSNTTKSQLAIVKRRTISKEIISIQNFLDTAIDKSCLQNNPFFNQNTFYSDPLKEYAWKTSDNDKLRHIKLWSLKWKNELPDSLKPELEKYDEELIIARKKHDKWELDMTEYNLQKILMDKQKESLKKCHEYIVKLYSLDPRADGELLELFSKSKYPETEKVKILMELKIPYKNFRRWESQDRKFQTNAQFISLDKPTQNVTLEKPNGKKTVVKLYVLRYADKKYIQDLLNEKPK